MYRLLALVALFGGVAARADGSLGGAQLPPGVTLAVHESRIVARRGPLRAPLSSDLAAEVLRIEPGAAGRLKITFTNAVCLVDRELEIGRSAVEARLENAAALALHRRRRFAEAEAGFAKALVLDPELAIAATNLASAQLLQGKRDAALKTLEPLLAKHPLETYARVAEDPELQPLLDDRKIKALRAERPGTATLAGMKHGVAVSGDRVAVRRTAGAYLYCFGTSALDVFDLASGARLETIAINEGLPVVGDDPEHCRLTADSKKKLARRSAEIDRMLADLGFDAPTDAEQQPFSRDENFKSKARFDKARFGLVQAGPGATMRVLRGDRELASLDGVGEPLHGVFLPSAAALVIFQKGAGCHDWESDEVSVFKVDSK